MRSYADVLVELDRRIANLQKCQTVLREETTSDIYGHTEYILGDAILQVSNEANNSLCSGTKVGKKIWLCMKRIRNMCREDPHLGQRDTWDVPVPTHDDYLQYIQCWEKTHKETMLSHKMSEELFINDVGKNILFAKHLWDHYLIAFRSNPLLFDKYILPTVCQSPFYLAMDFYDLVHNINEVWSSLKKESLFKGIIEYLLPTWMDKVADRRKWATFSPEDIKIDRHIYKVSSRPEAMVYYCEYCLKNNVDWSDKYSIREQIKNYFDECCTTQSGLQNVYRHMISDFEPFIWSDLAEDLADLLIQVVQRMQNTRTNRYGDVIDDEEDEE